MPVNFKELFGLKDSFTKAELKNALLKKLQYIDNLNISPLDKKLLIESVYLEYNKAKQYLLSLDNYQTKQSNQIKQFNPIEHYNYIARQQQELFKQFDNILNTKMDMIIPESKSFTKSLGKSYSMQSVLNPDGTTTVIETTNNMINGKSDKKINTYKISLDGKKILIE